MDNDKKPAIIQKDNTDIWADSVNVPNFVKRLNEHFACYVDDIDKKPAAIKACIECFSDFIGFDSMKKLVAECNAEYGNVVLTTKEYIRKFMHKFIDTCDLYKLEKFYIAACYFDDKNAIRYDLKNLLDIFLDKVDIDRFFEIMEHSQEPCAKFFALLDKYRQQKNLTPPQMYNAAGINKGTYSAIKRRKVKRPKKITALAFCIGLNLTLPQAQELLGTLDYELSDDSPVDRIVSQCLERGNYDIQKVDKMIFGETGDAPFKTIEC